MIKCDYDSHNANMVLEWITKNDVPTNDVDDREWYQKLLTYSFRANKYYLKEEELNYIFAKLYKKVVVKFLVSGILLLMLHTQRFIKGAAFYVPIKPTAKNLKFHCLAKVYTDKSRCLHGHIQQKIIH